MGLQNLIVGVPAAAVELVQQGLIERAFHDGLFPALMFRSEAQEEEWPANSGTEIFMSRPGLLPAVTKPLAPGVDPVPQTVAFEQWRAVLARYGATIDTHVPTSVVASSDLFVRNIHQLGLQAGLSVNRIPRNELFKAYLSGQTNLIVAAANTDTTIRVASVNGFTDVVSKGVNVAPKPVSAANPLAITVAGITGVLSVVGVDLDDPNDAYGPGTLYLSAAIGGAGASLRAPVLSVARPFVIRSGGGTSVDAISSGDVFQVQDILNATARLRKNNVMPHEDGFFHAHISNDGNTQVFTDPVFQRLNQTAYNGEPYQEAFLGTLGGCKFYLNNEAPDYNNTGARTVTGTNSSYSEDIGAETTNATGVNIGRIIVTGRGALYERRLDESAYVTEAGITGKEAEFQVVNQGIEVQTDGVRLLLRAPVNRMMDQVAATWSITTSFPVPTDVASGGTERFKRAVVIEHALDS
jgi:hypothetical protein